MNFARKFKRLSDKVTKFLFSSEENKVSRIIYKSVACFVFGALITTLCVVSINNASQHSGQGGFETSAVPEFDEVLDSQAEAVNLQVNEAALASQQSGTDEILEEIFAAEEEKAKKENKDTKAVAAAEDPVDLTYLTYRVKEGDMIGVIADVYGITQDTIISINNIKQSRLLQVGQYLKIPSMAGILYTVKSKGETPATIAKKYEVDAAKCAVVNNFGEDAEIPAGTSVFVPDAQLDWATRQEINGDLFKKPLRNRYYLSSYYGWRNSPFNTGKRSFHGGIDMACPKGTPIYPSMDGVVTATGYNSTYGNYVIIQHHSGYKTLYGHMSKILCKKGNFVYTSTKIGLVGSTGMSTGPHLHFTVYKNGKSVNPLPLLNKR